MPELTPFVSHISCTSCGRRYAADALHTVCDDDGRPLEIVYDLTRLRKVSPGLAWMRPQAPGMWRYGQLLPITPPDALPPIGWTPLEALPSDGFSGLQVSIKEEGEPRPGFGSNPTESFKDRGIGMAAAMAHFFGVSRLSIPTQGNAGDALITLGKSLGQELYVAMPESTPAPILDRAKEASITDPTLELLLSPGTIREAGAMLRKATADLDTFSVATFAEPGWRIEGKKTMGLEIIEQLGWELPDVIVYPTGGGTGILGIWKACQELLALGCVQGTPPRMIAVQSEGTDPLVKAMQSGAEDSVAADAGDTLATGLNVPYGIGHKRVLEILRTSGGTAVTVSEASIRSEMDGRPSISPEGAACMAVCRTLVDQGLAATGERVVMINTCSPAKYA
jgi:threonine synthase